MHLNLMQSADLSVVDIQMADEKKKVGKSQEMIMMMMAEPVAPLKPGHNH